MLKSDARWHELEHVQAKGNDIPQVSDLQNFGVEDLWSVADFKRGDDCDGISLWKRQALFELGWTIDDLSLCICWADTDPPSGHMVLLAQLGDTTFVLDSRRDFVVPWAQVPYRWVRRQKFGSKVWEDIQI